MILIRHRARSQNWWICIWHCLCTFVCIHWGGISRDWCPEWRLERSTRIQSILRKWHPFRQDNRVPLWKENKVCVPIIDIQLQYNQVTVKCKIIHWECLGDSPVSISVYWINRTLNKYHAGLTWCNKISILILEGGNQKEKNPRIFKKLNIPYSGKTQDKDDMSHPRHIN